MSDYTKHNEKRIATLIFVTQGFIEGGKGPELIKEYDHILQQSTPQDVITAVDEMVKLDIPMSDLKRGINKLLNQLFKALNSYKSLDYKEDGFLASLAKNNIELDLRLKAIRPLFKSLNKESEDESLKLQLKEKFEDLTLFDKQYIIKENILFPLLEKYWNDFRCVKVMWSIHDDIRENLKLIINSLSKSEFDLKKFNRLVGDLFFNMYAIKFREEKILFPIILESIDESEIDSLLVEANESGFPYVQADISKAKQVQASAITNKIDLKTGNLSVDQIRMIFNHLPVDITYVDENDKVCFFSTPEKRIFPRSKSIIGRDVKNCHPHESVHIVEKIVAAFKKGEKKQADFWIQMKGEFILIQYFAIHDQDGKYKGVMEVSQEVSEIRALEGERKLLNWD